MLTDSSIPLDSVDDLLDATGGSPKYEDDSLGTIGDSLDSRGDSLGTLCGSHDSLVVVVVPGGHLPADAD